MRAGHEISTPPSVSLIPRFRDDVITSTDITYGLRHLKLKEKKYSISVSLATVFYIHAK